MRAWLELSAEEKASWLQMHHQPPLRARQIGRWILTARVTAFSDMTDLPGALRELLAKEFLPLGTQIAHHHASSDGTHKLLLRLSDGQHIECVLIQEHDRHTACISTQVGCGMGCV